MTNDSSTIKKFLVTRNILIAKFQYVFLILVCDSTLKHSLKKIKYEF